MNKHDPNKSFSNNKGLLGWSATLHVTVAYDQSPGMLLFSHLWGYPFHFIGFLFPLMWVSTPL